MDSCDRTVVVGVDGTPEALVAARYALAEAALRGLGVRLLYSYPLPLMDVPTSAGFIDDFRDAGQTVLDDAVGALEVPPGVKLTTELDENLPALLMEQLSRTAELMVVGQHAVAWYDRLGRGSVASPLAHHSWCPVVVVPPTWRQDGRDRRPVVAALDGRTGSSSVLAYALDEAALLGTEVVALHVVPAGPSPQAPPAGRNVAELFARARAGRTGPPARVTTVWGDPQEVVLAGAQDAALLVVGHPHTSGATSWARSLARKIMPDVTCPLVVVPHEVQRPSAASPSRSDVLVAS